MANWPPLKSCCSLCLASLLSFTMATTDQRNEEPNNHHRVRRELRCLLQAQLPARGRCAGRRPASAAKLG